jgi:hypothetical protein
VLEKTVLYTNADGLLNKKDELLTLVDETKPSIIAVTEAKAKNHNHFNLSEYAIQGYDTYCNSNSKRGVVIYVKETLNSQLCPIMNQTDFEESVWIKFTSGDRQNILFGCIYKSPNGDNENEKKMFELLKRDVLNEFDCVCITGDFNFPNIDWSGKWSGEREESFIEVLRDAFLIQTVTKPTRRREGQRANILDLVIVNDEKVISEVEHLPPLGKSDHEVLKFQLYLAEKEEERTHYSKFDFNKANFKQMQRDMQEVDWSVLLDLNVEQCWDSLKGKIHCTMEKNIPKSKVKLKDRQKPKWMSRKALKIIKKKYNLYKRFLNTKRGSDYQAYIKARNECSRQIRNCKIEFEKKLSEECKRNPKAFWKYVQSKTKTKTGISPLINKDGNVMTDDKGKADTLNKFFASVFTKDDTTHNTDTDNTLSESPKEYRSILDSVVITSEIVKKKLEALNPNKAQGPDAIPPRILKELSNELAKPFSILFSKSIDTGTIPSEWKRATVTPIFKKGTRTDPGNYRPVSLTCVSCKLLESIVRDSIVEHMKENSLYAKCQHGFRSHRSCITQLLEVMEDFTKALDEGEWIDVLYLDFRKAFDSVSHPKLINKMKTYGIHGNILKWTQDFLNNRTQKVKVGNDFSAQADVLSGIPQGSILGPILFTIFINDLPDEISSPCKIFADDTKLYNFSSGHQTMQNDINKLIEWSENWKLFFNGAKCKVLHIGKNNPERDYTMRMDEQEIVIAKCEEEKDLGVIFDRDLSFDRHIAHVVNKANQVIGIIKRTFTFLDKSMFIRLYKTLVRPLLEYGNVIWYPRLKRQSAMIERVQRRATKLIYELRDNTYEERLRILELPSLKARRVRGDLIQTYKIFNDIDDIDRITFFELNPTNITRNSLDKIFIQHCANNTRKCSYSQRVAPLWNKLTPNIKRAQNTNVFKSLIDKHFILTDIWYNYDD